MYAQQPPPPFGAHMAAPPQLVLLRFDHASMTTERTEVASLCAQFGEVAYVDFRFGEGWAPATAGPLALTLDQCIISAITVTVTVLDTKTGADDTSATFYYELPTVFDVDTAAVVSGGHSSNPSAGVTRTFSRVIDVPAEHRLEMPRRVARRTAKH